MFFSSVLYKGNTVWRKNWIRFKSISQALPGQLLRVPSFCLTSSFGKLGCPNAKRCHGAWPVNNYNASKVQERCTASSNDYSSILPRCHLCCSLIPCSEVLIAPADQGPCSDTTLKPYSTNHYALLAEKSCTAQQQCANHTEGGSN